MAKPRALVGILSPEIRDDIVRAAGDLVDLVAVNSEPDMSVVALDADESNIGVVIVDVITLRALIRRMRRIKPAPNREAPSVVLVLLKGDLQDALGVLHLCRGILFWEHDIDKLSRMLVLTLEGYSAVRGELLPDLVTDRVRVGLIERLAPVEQHTLRLLGDALSNRAIAGQLNVAEPVAKSLVRTVLTKLRLKNRPVGGVGVARGRGDSDAVPARQPDFSPEQIAS